MRAIDWVIYGGRLPLVHLTEGGDGTADPEMFTEQFVPEPCSTCNGSRLVGISTFPRPCPECSHG